MQKQFIQSQVGQHGPYSALLISWILQTIRALFSFLALVLADISIFIRRHKSLPSTFPFRGQLYQCGFTTPLDMPILSPLQIKLLSSGKPFLRSFFVFHKYRDPSSIGILLTNSKEIRGSSRVFLLLIFYFSSRFTWTNLPVIFFALTRKYSFVPILLPLLAAFLSTPVSLARSLKPSYLLFQFFPSWTSWREADSYRFFFSLR